MLSKCLFCFKTIENGKYYLDVKEGILHFCTIECKNCYIKTNY